MPEEVWHVSEGEAETVCMLLTGGDRELLRPVEGRVEEDGRQHFTGQLTAGELERGTRARTLELDNGFASAVL